MLYPCVFVAFLFFDFFENAAWQPQGEMRDRGANAAVIGLWKNKFSNKKQWICNNDRQGFANPINKQIIVREFLHYGMGQ